MINRLRPFVLYVDDEEMNLTLFEITFQDQFKVITSKDAFEGLSVVEENGEELDIIVSDMRMPGMDGIDFITKAKEKHPHLACFILTGFAANEKVANALKDKLIVNSFSKPFDTDLIHQSVIDSMNR